MQIDSDPGSATYRITHFSEQQITVSGRTLRDSILIMPEFLSAWEINNINHLTKEHCLYLISFNPEVILFGTGNRQIFPSHEIFSPLYEKSIGFEVMDTASACRTYTVLMAENRLVLAALIQN